MFQIGSKLTMAASDFISKSGKFGTILKGDCDQTGDEIKISITQVEKSKFTFDFDSLLMVQNHNNIIRYFGNKEKIDSW